MDKGFEYMAYKLIGQSPRARERLLNKLLNYLDTIAPNARDFENESGFSIDYEAWESICTDIENLKLKA